MAKQIGALTGIRGVAAMWVVLLHASGYVSLDNVLSSSVMNVIKRGWLGVDLFFVLSGFVISYVHQADFVRLSVKEYARFLKLRLARIYPAHLVSTLLLIPIVLGAMFFSLYHFSDEVRESYSVSRLAYSLVLLNGWGFADSTGWNLPSWSVGSEWFAYLLFPFTAVILNRISSWISYALVIVGIFSLMVYLAVELEGMQQYMLGPSFVTLRVSSEFLVGCVLYNIFTRMRENILFDLGALASVIAIVVLSAIGVHSFYDFVIISLFATLVLCLSRSNGGAAYAFSHSGLLYLGKISYSIYLIHATVLIFWNQAFRYAVAVPHKTDVILVVAFYVTYLLACIAAGHTLYKLVEEPGRSFIRHRWIRT